MAVASVRWSRHPRDESAAVAVSCDSLLEASDRFARMLVRVTDPTLPAIGVWNIGETACHVAESARYFLGAMRGETELEHIDDLGSAHARQLVEHPERGPAALAQRLQEGVTELVAYARTLDANLPVEAFAGIEVPLSTVLAIELGEKLVHGFDIGRATKLPWVIDRADAAITLHCLLAMMPFVVDNDEAADVEMTFELRIRGGPRQVLAVDHGTLRVEPPSARRLDFRLSVDPVAYLLLTFNRVTPLPLMLQGKLVAWGRRPWMASAFESLLKRV